jgi:anti-sigma factor ChrR (cupin superfamily)
MSDVADLASRYITVDDLPWQSTPVPGIDMKVLMKQPDGMMTCLFRWQPGTRLPLHEHVGIEQSYLLEGSLVDHEGEVTAGNFVWRPGGSRHDAYAPNGALVLAMFQTPNIFLEQHAGQRLE